MAERALELALSSSDPRRVHIVQSGVFHLLRRTDDPRAVTLLTDALHVKISYTSLQAARLLKDIRNIPEDIRDEAKRLIQKQEQESLDYFAKKRKYREIELAKLKDRLRRLNPRWPTEWIENEDYGLQLLTIIDNQNTRGERCPYFKSGVCMFGPISKRDTAQAPRACSLVESNYKRCHVWNLDPR